MKKYNIKQYIPQFILIFVFICLQVFSTTEIPKYMANNINVGVIQNGVDKDIITKLDDKTFNLLVNNVDNKEEFINSYELKDNFYYISKKSNKKILENETKNAITKIIKTDNPNAHFNFISKINESLDNSNATKYIKLNSLKMLEFAILGAIFVIISSYIISKTTARFSTDLRKEVFKKVNKFSNNNMNKFGVASLLTRTTNDITNLQLALNNILKISILAPITLVISSINAYRISRDLMKVLFVLSLILLVVIIIAIILLVPLMEKTQKNLDKTNNILREILTGKRVIRAFNKQEYENKKYDEVNKENRRLNRYSSIVLSIINPIAGFILSITAVLIVYYVSKIITIKNIGLGHIFAFIQYGIQIMVSFLMLTSIFFVIPNAIISFRRIDDVLNEEIEIKNESDYTLDRIKKIEFKNVSYRYDHSEDDIVNDISFVLNENETLSIIGGTGSGKTTIIKLILRLLDNTNGKILINDREIKDVNIKSLRSKISYTPQTAKVFSGTVLENISYNDKNSNKERAIRSIKMACAEEFADLDRDIQQRGANLSGGQKQRIQIARSIYKNPDVIIFDDSFSALDNVTDKKIRDNLKEMNMIKIYISQKISTIKDSNKIMVLNEGKVVGVGTHNELLNSCDVYKEIYNTQVGGAYEK